MSQSQDTQLEPSMPQTTAELLSRIDQAWSSLEQLVHGLSETQLTTARDSQGWSVKDHLAHITAWEQSLLALLAGQDRDQAVGVGETDTTALETDDVNAMIFQRNQQRAMQDVFTTFHRSHAQVCTAIAALSDADLRQPYSHYQPNDPPAEDAPVIHWIIGNTYEHYAEHIAWIQTLLTA